MSGVPRPTVAVRRIKVKTDNATLGISPRENINLLKQVKNNKVLMSCSLCFECFCIFSGLVLYFDFLVSSLFSFL